MNYLTTLVKMFVRIILFFFLPLTILLVLLFFPYDTDPPINEPSSNNTSTAVTFYNNAYDKTLADAGSIQKAGSYVETAKNAAGQFGVQEYVMAVVNKYGLQNAKVLDVGSGSGTLQDMVNDYTGLDIAATAAAYYHKPFVAASADSIPFPDNKFDAVWSIWMLEHVNNPERVLEEMRRVLKPHGLLLLMPAWNCSPWASQGYQSRSYGQLDFYGKLMKASMPFLNAAEVLARNPIRRCRSIQYSLYGTKTRLRFRALHPSYNVYWEPDSDAAISIDSYEALLWFRARGDESLDGRYLFRIHK